VSQQGRVTVDPFGPEIEAFVAHMRLQERSERTVSAYMWGLKHFRVFFGDRQITTFAGITRELIEEWQYYLASPLVGRKPLAPRSRSLAASGVRMFFTWAAIRDKCDAKLALWFTKVKVAELQPRPIANDSMVRIRHYFLEKTGTPRYLRDRALFFYTVGVGARVAEVLRVPREGWEKVTVVQKGGSTKVLTCPDHAAEMVRAYLRTRVDDDPALWVNRPGTAQAEIMTPASVRAIWAALAKRLGVVKWTTHQLRHTAATAMLAAGEDPLTVATFLGHKNLATLRVYAAIPEATRQKAVASMDRWLKAG
jgi:site-specific recombinase XerD